MCAEHTHVQWENNLLERFPKNRAVIVTNNVSRYMKINLIIILGESIYLMAFFMFISVSVSDWHFLQFIATAHSIAVFFTVRS